MRTGHPDGEFPYLGGERCHQCLAIAGDLAKGGKDELSLWADVILHPRTVLQQIECASTTGR
jgi:hypothetical protein